MKKQNEMVVCADGFSMSVQASEFSYCEPRESGASRYTAVEVGYPSQREELLMQWCEDAEEPTQTVYGWVPSQTVALVVAKHGGVVSGELPAGVPFLPASGVTLHELPKGWED